MSAPQTVMSARNNPLGIGIVSYGGAGQAQRSHFTVMSGCEVRAVFDPEPEARRRAIARAPALLVTGDLAELLAADVDAIAVCSPDSTHAPYVESCLGAEKHVVCEKPLTDTVAGYERILEAQRRRPRLVCSVQHQMRFLPVHLKIRELIRSNILDQVCYIEGYCVHNLKKRSSVLQTPAGYLQGPYRFSTWKTVGLLQGPESVFHRPRHGGFDAASGEFAPVLFRRCLSDASLRAFNSGQRLVA